MSGRKKVFTNYQYPFPAEPSKWDQEERNFSQGLRHLFDILFSRKVQNVLIADDAVTSRNIKSESVGLRHLVNGFGRDLDISGNETVARLTDIIETAQETADDAVADAAAAQRTADAVPNTLYPIGIIILNGTAPGFGTWTQVDIGVPAVTAWQRTA